MKEHLSTIYHTIGHKEFRYEVHVPITAFSHWLGRFAGKAEALVELDRDKEPEVKKKKSFKKQINCLEAAVWSLKSNISIHHTPSLVKNLFWAIW